MDCEAGFHMYSYDVITEDALGVTSSCLGLRGVSSSIKFGVELQVEIERAGLPEEATLVLCAICALPVDGSEFRQRE